MVAFYVYTKKSFSLEILNFLINRFGSTYLFQTQHRHNNNNKLVVVVVATEADTEGEKTEEDGVVDPSLDNPVRLILMT